MADLLAGKVALVTGGAQGLGLAATRLLLRHGAKVGILDYSKTVLDSTCKELQQEYGVGRVHSLLCDVTDNDKLVSAFAELKNKFGSLDIVLNNAGVSEDKPWEMMLKINLHAVILGTETALEHMSVFSEGGKGGVVINVASMAGIYPTDWAVYSATKSAVVAYTRSMKTRSEAVGVRVNCICPWFADTRMGQLARDLGDDSLRSLIKKKGLVKPSMVAEGVLELITDTTRSGAVLKVTPTRGLSYHNFSTGATRSKL